MAKHVYGAVGLLILLGACAATHERSERGGRGTRDTDDGHETEHAPVAPADEAPDEPFEEVPTSSAPAADAGAQTGGWEAGGDLDAGQGLNAAAEAGPLGIDPAPPDAVLQQFDPKQVYVFGIFGSIGLDCDLGIAPALAPTRVLARMPCDGYGSMSVRPTDGRLLYAAQSQENVRVFSCVGCAHGPRAESVPGSNSDEPIPSPCAPHTRAFPSFAVLPHGGVVEQCGAAWLDARGQHVAATQPGVWAFGHANTALRWDGILSLSDGKVRPLVGLPMLPIETSRVREDGYWLVLGGEPPELWHVRFDGTAMRVGSYPLLPDGRRAWGAAKLDAEGNLYDLTGSADNVPDLVARRTLAGGSEVVYRFPTPGVSVSLVYLVTAP